MFFLILLLPRKEIVKHNYIGHKSIVNKVKGLPIKNRRQKTTINNAKKMLLMTNVEKVREGNGLAVGLIRA